MLPGSALTGKVVDEKFIYDNRDWTRKPFEFYKDDEFQIQQKKVTRKVYKLMIPEYTVFTP